MASRRYSRPRDLRRQSLRGVYDFDDPASIPASLRDRDQIWQDDYAWIILDTYGDFGYFYKTSLRESPIILTQQQRQ